MEIKGTWRTFLKWKKKKELDCREVEPIFRMGSSLPFPTTTLSKPTNGLEFCRFIALGVRWWVTLESMCRTTSPSIDEVAKLVK